MDVRAVLGRVGVLGLATTRQLAAHGVSRSASSRAAAAGELVRVRRGVYGLAPLPPLPRHLVTDAGPAPELLQHVRADLLAVPGAVACGRTAAAVRGWGLLVEPRRTQLAVPYGTHAAGVRRRRAPDSEEVVPGVRATGAVETVVACCLELPLLQAVVVADSALRSRQVSVRALRSGARDLRGRRDAARVRAVLELVDPESGSVLESVLRVLLLQAGLVGFASQVLLGPALRVDFAHAGARLVLEADGARWHPEPARDRDRDNRLAVLGWRVLRVTWSEVVHDGPAVVRTVRAALQVATSSVRSTAGDGRDGARAA